ncbi:hypothetical protein PoB_000054100 [Plakobranchus ocellatus]|uniref:Tetraspanin n=1 Tax=Plakobranchus ocellatus TaxID=259542 RepID=A0AAV3XVH7_9GAST|nr:hypothetical protein PoB_000054100 [Plakobranchus ocellatus]
MRTGHLKNSRKPEDENACRDDGNKNTNWRWKHDSDTDEDTDEDDDDDNDDESYHVEYTKPKHDLSAQLQKWAEKDTLFNLKIDDAYENISTNYLSGKRWLDAALVGWHMIVLTVTLAVIGFMFLLRFSFESYIIFMMKRLSSFDTYKRILTTPNPNTNFHIYGDASNLTEALMILNSLYAACILVYLAYYLHKCSITLPVMLVTTSVLYVMELTYVNVFYHPTVIGTDEKVEELVTKLTEEYKPISSNEFSVVQDYISIWLECCGVNDRFDFYNTTLLLKGTKRERIAKIPPTCCRRRVFNEGLDRVIQCAIKGGEKDIHPKGCMGSFLEWLQHLCHMYSVYSWLHLFDCVLHVIVYKRKVKMMKNLLFETFGDSIRSDDGTINRDAQTHQHFRQK